MPSSIEWTDETWNPIRARITDPITGQVRIGWFCEHVSEGCRHCYAEQKNKGFFNLGTGLPFNRQSRDKVEIFLDEDTLLEPLHWRKPRKIFVCSMTDWMGEWVPDEWIDKILAIAALCPQHTFQFLTKRAERLPRYFNDPDLPRRIDDLISQDGGMMRRSLRASPLNGEWPLPNVHLYVSAEDQKSFDERWGYLRQTPAVVRGLSLEPLLAPINIRSAVIEDHYNCDEGTDDDPTPTHRCWPRVDHVIVGGESGPHARPMHPDWARSIRNQCLAADVAYFFKQHGEWSTKPQLGVDYGMINRAGKFTHWKAQDYFKAQKEEGAEMIYRNGKHIAGRLLDGQEYSQFPEVSNAR